MKDRIMKMLIICIMYNLLMISCCNEPETFSKILDFSITLKEINYNAKTISNLDTTATEKLALVTDFNYTYEAYTNKNFSNNSCFASDCAGGQKGLKNKIKTIEVFSSSKFNNINVGETLNNMITCSYDEPDGDKHHLDNVPIETAINSINSWNEFFLYYSFKLLLMKNPLSNLKENLK
jgi:hypothetical protein